MPLVSLQERRQALLADYDLRTAEQLALPVAQQRLTAIITKAFHTFRARRSIRHVTQVLAVNLPRAYYDALLPAMIFVRMKGWQRTLEAASKFGDFALASGPSGFASALAQVRKRLKMPASILQELAGSMNRQALLIAKDASAAAEDKLRAAFAQTVKRGEHLEAGVARLERAFASAGLAPQQPFQLETIFRTQTMLAYAAGEAEMLRQPAVDEILWGYKYVTVGDDRVRPTHLALEGVTLPKDDPFWDKNKPPNGYNCRCRIIPLFDEREEVEPPAKIIVGDQVMTPGADPGFGFDPGNAFGAVTLPELN